jgi:hypothetical protein
MWAPDLLARNIKAGDGCETAKLKSAAVGQHGTFRSTKSPPQSRHSTRIGQANPDATNKWNILTSLNEDLMKTLKS